MATHLSMFYSGEYLVDCPNCNEELTADINYLPTDTNVWGYREIIEGYTCMSCGWDTEEGTYKSEERREGAKHEQ